MEDQDTVSPGCLPLLGHLIEAPLGKAAAGKGSVFGQIWV